MGEVYTAHFCRLREGGWGVRVRHRHPLFGDTLFVSKRDATMKVVTLTGWVCSGVEDDGVAWSIYTCREESSDYACVG